MRNGARIFVSSVRVRPVAKNERSMRKDKPRARKRGLREEYDFSKGVRGKYASRYAGASNVVVLDPDVAKVFPDSHSVNHALRVLVRAKRANKASSTKRKLKG